METFTPEHYIGGLYDLVYLGEPLRFIISNISLELEQGHTVINLLNYLPLLKEGYCSKKTIINILTAYIELINAKNLIEITVFNKAFGGDIPVEFYITQISNPSDAYGREFILEPISVQKLEEFLKGQVKVKSTKIPIQQAVEQGLVNRYINTYEYEQLINQKFDFNDIYTDLYFLIADNIYTMYELHQLGDYFDDITFMKSINKETQLSADIEDLMNEMIKQEKRSPFNFIDAVKACELLGADTLMDKFEKDKQVKLYYAIIIGKYKKVIKYLGEIDPREDNNEAYQVAIKSNDIINAIKDNIIERNWYQKSVLGTNIESVIGQSDIPSSLQTYIQKLQ